MVLYIQVAMSLTPMPPDRICDTEKTMKIKNVAYELMPGQELFLHEVHYDPVSDNIVHWGPLFYLFDKWETVEVEGEKRDMILGIMQEPLQRAVRDACRVE